MLMMSRGAMTDTKRPVSAEANAAVLDCAGAALNVMIILFCVTLRVHELS